MLFSALLFLISCIGSLGQFLYPWANKTEQAPKKENIEVARHNKLTHLTGSHPVNTVQLEYPADMLGAQKEGKVVLSCNVEATGKPSDCQVIESSGQKSFDSAALRYVMRSLFSPAIKDGLPVKEYAHHYVVHFKLGQ